MADSSKCTSFDGSCAETEISKVRLAEIQLTISQHNCSDVIMSAMESQITVVSMVCSTVCSGADQRKHQSSTSLAFMRGIHQWPVYSPNKGSVTRKMFPFDDVIMAKIHL